MISFDVVPRTMESVRVRSHEETRVIQTRLTIDDQDILSGELEGHGVQLFADILTPGWVVGIRHGWHGLCALPTSSVDRA